MSLQKLLAQKLKTDGLSALKASKMAGMSYVGFCNLLKGKSTMPQARTLPRLARLLGLSVKDIAGPAKPKAGKSRPGGGIGRGKGKGKASKGIGRTSKVPSDAVLRAVGKELAKLQALVESALQAAD